MFTLPTPTRERAAKRMTDALLGGFDTYLDASEIDLSGLAMRDFIRDTLGFNMWDTQEAIVNAVDHDPRVTVRSCHSAGKSAVSARIAIAFLHTRERSIVVTTAPTNRQVQHVLWRYINTAARSAKGQLMGRPLQTRYEIAPDWYAIGFKGDNNNSDAFQGFHAEHILVIADESAGIAESVFEGIESILTGTGARLLMIGNPTSLNGTFRESFHGSAHLYKTLKISAYDTPNFTHFGITREHMIDGTWREKVKGRKMPFPALVDPYWVQRQFEIHGPESPYVKARIDAEFPADTGSVLIALSWIEAAENLAGDLEPAADDPWYAGVDVARFGDDETSILVRKGPCTMAHHSWNGNDTMESTGHIRHILSEVGASDAEVRVDVVGMGAGIADRLRELEYRVEDVNVGSASSDKTKWQNLRHELWWQLRERYREGLIAPGPGRAFDDVMKSQLSDILFKYTSSYTHPLIEKKEDAKKRGVRSPDRAEAQMLAYADLPRGEAGVFLYGSSKGVW